MEPASRISPHCTSSFKCAVAAIIEAFMSFQGKTFWTKILHFQKSFPSISPETGKMNWGEFFQLKFAEFSNFKIAVEAKINSSQGFCYAIISITLKRTRVDSKRMKLILILCFRESVRILGFVSLSLSSRTMWTRARHLKLQIPPKGANTREFVQVPSMSTLINKVILLKGRWDGRI